MEWAERRRAAGEVLVTGVRRVLRRARPTLDRRDRLDLLESLSDSGCASCRARENAVRRWFWTYENDTAGDLTMRLGMERSLGLCAAHTRRLLALGPPSSWLATALFADVAHAGLRSLADRTRPATPAAPCPPCRIGADAAADLLARLSGALADPEGEPDVATNFWESDGLCLRHTRQALRAADRVAGTVVLTGLAEQLGRDPSSVLIALCGSDPDVGRRAAMWRGSGPGSHADCCGSCSGRLRAEWSALDRSHSASGPLCGTHLAVLATGGLTDAVTATIDATATPWRTVLEPYHVGSSPGSAARRSVRAHLRAPTSCGVCAAGLAAAARASAAENVVVCLRHGLRIDPAERSRGDLVDRLRTLSAELDAARRAYASPRDTAIDRTAATAWKRAPAVLDGAVLGPAGFSASS